MRVFRFFVIFAVLAGLVLKLLQYLGVIGGGECDPGCECSQGQPECLCGHQTCLAPATT